MTRALLLSRCGSRRALRKWRVDFTETTLKNGLRVQLVEDRSAPVIALNIAYDVGSRNERKGLTGFAHLFEHMMFKGRRTSAKASTSIRCSQTAAR